MLTPNDLRDPTRQSGFRFVNGSPASKGGFYARVQQSRSDGRPGSDAAWIGPRRTTALEATQDYCDYVNGRQQAPPQPVLRSAGHKRAVSVKLTGDTTDARIALLRAELRTLEAERKMKRGSRGFIYLVAEEAFESRSGETYILRDAVKIGWSESPDARIATLQTGNPRKLILLGTKPGTVDDEKALHAKYIGQNVLQEWFRPTQELLSEFGWYINVNTNRELWIRRTK